MKDLAHTHYENFPVASFILPRSLRRPISAVYAFARTADDFADEPQYEGKRLEALNDFEQRVLNLDQTPEDDPLFFPLREAVKKFDIPISLFLDLLTAFKKDVAVSRYKTFEELLDYCRFSANPVGRIVLHIMGYPAPRFMEYSDQICTALQLTNFWQDLFVDLDKNRIYLPQEDMARFGTDETKLSKKMMDQNLKRLVLYEVERTRELFASGWPLCKKIPGRLGWELTLTWVSGNAILDQIVERQGNVLTQRPRIKKWEWIPLLLKTRALRRRERV